MIKCLVEGCNFPSHKYYLVDNGKAVMAYCKGHNPRKGMFRWFVDRRLSKSAAELIELQEAL